MEKKVDFLELVKDKVKLTFAELMTNEEWDNLIKEEVDAFFNKESIIEYSARRDEATAWGARDIKTTSTNMTPFRAIVWRHCTDMAITVVKEKIDKEYFSNQYSGPGEMGEEMKKVIVEAAPLAAANFFKSISMGMMSSLRTEIQNHHI